MDKHLNPKFSYYNPVKIISEPGILKTINSYLPSGKTLLITDGIFTKKGVTSQLIDAIGADNITVYDRVLPNPELDDIDNAVKVFRNESFSSVTALGGGSVLDFAKAVAVLLADGRGRLLDDFLRTGTEKIPHEKLYLIAIPTTSGTGSEVTPFATVWDSVTGKKHSLAGNVVYPDIALLDPALTLEIPREVSLFTGLDAVSHSLESLWNKNRSAVSEAFAFESLRLSLRSLPAVLENPGSIEARSDMQCASTLGGLAISQTKTAIAHSISYPLTLKYDIPHGLACSFTLPGLIDIFIENNNDPETVKICGDVRKMITSFSLPDRVKKYASLEESLSLTGEMYNPARADNYVYSADDLFIKELIVKSFK